MPLDKQPADREEKLSYEGEIDADARAAYAEVMGRIKDADAGDGKGHGEGAASREPAAKGGKQPAESKEEPRDDSRDARGRFKSKAEPAGDPKQPAQREGDGNPGKRETEPNPDAAAAKPAGGEPAAGGPPPSFSVKTKAEWDKLPEHVRADILKRETEMASGLKALQDYKDLKPYQELALKHNTTIPKALDHFLRIENLLKQDLSAGMALIAQNFGLSQQQAAMHFAKLAQKLAGGSLPVSSQAPGNPTAPAGADGKPDPLAEALQPILGPMLQPLLQELQQLKGTVASREQADRNAVTQSLDEALKKFAADPANRYFADLEETMTKLFERGMVPLTGNHAADIKAAYEMAAKLHPEVGEALIEQRLNEQREQQRKAEQEAAAKAKAASRSLTGSRMPGTTIKDKRDDEPESADDVEADVIRAFRQHANA
jgi:hypothetical protein